jgi:hypothetical protein
VADVHDADAGSAPLEHELVQLCDFLRAERRRRLVEEEHLRPRQQGFDHFQELSLRE